MATKGSDKDLNQFIDLHGQLASLCRDNLFISDENRLNKLVKLTELCCNALDVARASVWMLGDNGASISCEVLCIKDQGPDFTALSLAEENHPDYFKALKTAELIIANEACADPQTCSFSQGYFDLFGIESMLDAPIFNGPELYGVVCFESTFKRAWNVAETAFASSVADAISEMNSYDAWHESQRELDLVSFYDDLTGLPNLRSLKSFLHQLKNRDEQFGVSSSYTLFWLDLDNLQAINEGLGHQIGDQVILHYAKLLKHWSKPKFSFCARVTGDEFILLLEGNDDPSELEQVAYRLISRLNQPFLEDSPQLTVSTCIGLTSYHESFGDIEHWLKHAEAALFSAKANGRSQVALFDEGHQAKVQQHFQLEQQLRNAIINQTLSVYYQPIMASDGCSVVSAEALVRWHHPELGLLQPVDFLHVARSAGLMADLDQCVLGLVCDDLNSGLISEQQPLKVGLNLSADSLHQEDFSKRFLAFLKRKKISAQHIQLEITEDILQGDYTSVNDALREFVGHGMELSIDDFGTGYSSLARLKLLPFTKLKIDRSFIRDILDDPNDRAITLSVIGLANGLGLEVVAEGVECLQQEAWLQEQGCHFFQGYRYGKPLPFHQFAKQFGFAE